MSDTNVIIHIYPGRGKEEEREFYNKKELGINIFKEYLLEVLGHVGISFPPEKKNLWVWSNYNRRRYNSTEK